MKGLPLNLFLNGRPCLVVGGGKVALRKIELLLDAGAEVAVVSPECCSEVGALIETGMITHTVRLFERSDIAGATLVYAATGSRAVNREVLERCREKKILCCCVDGNWAQGDFTTPAITHHNQLTLSVSSGGNDGRQSKMVRNSLARHLKMMESANLVVVGTDHHHLTVGEREPFHLTGHRFERAGFMIMQLWGIHEFMILNTCNRVEVVAVVSDETAKNGILRHIMGFTALTEEQFYLKTGAVAFEHLCLVTAGMLSQTPGENHVTAQIKDALDNAKQRGWAGNMIQEWLSSALHISKAIKTRIAPMLRICEIEDLVLRYLEASGKDLSVSILLVLGSGTIGKGVVKDSLPKVKKIIWCYHANRPEIPDEWVDKVELCTFGKMEGRMAEADIVVGATEAPGYLLHRTHASLFNPERSVVLLDLGMPRNFDPELDHCLSHIVVVDLDGLKHWYRNELTDMNDIISCSRTVVADHPDLYEKIASSFQGASARD